MAIRETSGGLPCVKALGVPLDDRGIVQVSMNLTNYTITSIHTVFDAVESEASSRGIDILESELIGLIPAAALADTSAEYLRIADFRPDMILEERLRQKTAKG
jgi:glutamate formiminotransferase